MLLRPEKIKRFQNIEIKHQPVHIYYNRKNMTTKKHRARGQGVPRFHATAVEGLVHMDAISGFSSVNINRFAYTG